MSTVLFTEVNSSWAALHFHTAVAESAVVWIPVVLFSENTYLNWSGNINQAKPHFCPSAEEPLHLHRLYICKAGNTTSPRCSEKEVGTFIRWIMNLTLLLIICQGKMTYAKLKSKKQNLFISDGVLRHDVFALYSHVKRYFMSKCFWSLLGEDRHFTHTVFFCYVLALGWLWTQIPKIANADPPAQVFRYSHKTCYSRKCVTPGSTITNIHTPRSC